MSIRVLLMISYITNKPLVHAPYLSSTTTAAARSITHCIVRCYTGHNMLPIGQRSAHYSYIAVATILTTYLVAHQMLNVLLNAIQHVSSSNAIRNEAVYTAHNV
eukprot:17244-Heterococcus_DN1.PRE.1